MHMFVHEYTYSHFRKSLVFRTKILFIIIKDFKKYGCNYKFFEKLMNLPVAALGII